MSFEGVTGFRASHHALGPLLCRAEDGLGEEREPPLRLTNTPMPERPDSARLGHVHRQTRQMYITEALREPPATKSFSKERPDDMSSAPVVYTGRIVLHSMGPAHTLHVQGHT